MLPLGLQFVSIVPCPFPLYIGITEKSLPHALALTLYILITIDQILSHSSFLQAKWPQSAQLFLVRGILLELHHLCSLCWALARKSHTVLL